MASNRSKGVRTMDKERQQMVQLMGKTVGHVFEELDIVYRQHPEVQNDKHFHTALALLQGIQCMTWELENEEKPPAGEKELDNIEEQEYEKQFEEEMMRLQPELFEDN